MLSLSQDKPVTKSGKDAAKECDREAGAPDNFPKKENFADYCLSLPGSEHHDIILPERLWPMFNGKEGTCQNAQVFYVRMCQSYQCNTCQLDHCTKACQDIQMEYSNCRCPDWHTDRKSYSHDPLAR